jgi:hypothetical protein
MKHGQQLQSLAAFQALHKTSIQGQTHCQQHQIKHRSAGKSLTHGITCLAELDLCNLAANVQSVCKEVWE